MTHLELITLNYLLNALWQVPLIYLVAALAVRLTKPVGPPTEHRIWVTALILEIMLPENKRIQKLRIQPVHIARAASEIILLGRVDRAGIRRQIVLVGVKIGGVDVELATEMRAVVTVANI